MRLTIFLVERKREREKKERKTDRQRKGKEMLGHLRTTVREDAKNTEGSSRFVSILNYIYILSYTLA